MNAWRKNAWRKAAFAALALVAINTRAMAQCDYGDLAAEEAKVEAAPNCRSARTLYEACLWGSTADVGRGATVKDKCEAEFLPKASASIKSAYRAKLAACARKYAKREGTMFRSAEATCAADAAASFALGKSK